MRRSAHLGAARQRLYTERQRNGLVVLRVVCVELDIIEVLEAEGLLQSDPTRAELSDALSKWIYREMTRHRRAARDVP